jgi:hypothetical protein
MAGEEARRAVVDVRPRVTSVGKIVDGATTTGKRARAGRVEAGERVSVAPSSSLTFLMTLSPRTSRMTDSSDGVRARRAGGRA